MGITCDPRLSSRPRQPVVLRGRGRRLVLSPLEPMPVSEDSFNSTFPGGSAGGVSASPLQNCIRGCHGPLAKLMLFADERTLPTGGLPTAK